MYTDFRNFVTCGNARAGRPYFFLPITNQNRLYTIGTDKIRHFVGSGRVIRPIQLSMLPYDKYSPVWNVVYGHICRGSFAPHVFQGQKF